MKAWLKHYWQQVLTALTIFLSTGMLVALGYASQAKMADIVRKEFDLRGIVTTAEFNETKISNLETHRIIIKRIENVEATLLGYRDMVMTNQVLLLDIHALLSAPRRP